MGFLDDYYNWGSQVSSDVFGGIYDAFGSANQQAQKELLESQYIPGYSPALAGGKTLVGGLGNLFELINRPRDIATAAYAGLPYTDPNFEIPSAGNLAGSSLRDLAQEGYLLKALTGDVTTPIDNNRIENPYLLKGIEKVGGEFFDELADPTNIPGALVGAGGFAGRAASGLDKLFAGMGAVSGLGEGLPTIAGAGSSIYNEGLNPENFGQLLEGSIGAGFGGLSAGGLATDSTPTIERESLTPSQVYDLVAQNLGEVNRTPEESIKDEQIMDNLVRQMNGLPAVPYLEELTSSIPETSSNVLPFRNADIVLEQSLENEGLDSVLEKLGLEDLTPINESLVQELTSAEVVPEITIPTEDTALVAEPISPKEELSTYVEELKQKYGEKSWRKKMTTEESIEFRDKQLAIQGDAAPEVKLDQLKDWDDNLTTDFFMKKNDYVVKGTQESAKLADESFSGKERETFVNSLGGPNNTIDVYRVGETSPNEYQSYSLDPNKLGFFANKTGKQPTKYTVKASDIAFPGSFSDGEVVINSGKIQGNVPPPTIPPETTIEPEKPEPPARKLQNLSIAERAALPVLRNLTKASPEIGKAVKSYDDYHTELASENIAEVRATTQGVNKAGEQKIIRFLDGEDVQLDSHEAKVARDLRAVLNNIANLAGQNDVLVGYREGYFPRKYEDRFEWDVAPRAFDSKNKTVGSLEKSRKGNRQNFRRDFKVLEEYINEASRRISESKFLGKDLSKVLPQDERALSGDRPTAEYVSKSIRRVTGREGSSTPARFSDQLRRITALGDLGLAVLYQPAQFAHTASAVGLRRATRAAFKALTNNKQETLNATRSGALWPTISHEVSRALGDKGYMHLIPTMDKMMRVHANVAGRLLAQDALKGNSYAKRQLDDLKIKLDDPKLFDKVGNAIADKTQFRTGTLDLPLWTHSPMGKLAFQYSSFAYAQAKFAHDMLRHPVKNFGQIVRFAAMGAILGEGVGDLREMLRSLIPGKDEEDDVLRRMMEAAAGDNSFDSKPWLKKLQAVTRSKRIPTSSPGWRTIQNLSMAGGVGIFQNVLEKATSGRFYELPIGPAGSMLVDTAEAGRKDVQKGIEKGDWKFSDSLRNLIGNLPLPLLSNRKLADTIVPKKDRKKAKDPFDLMDMDFKDVKFDF